MQKYLLTHYDLDGIVCQMLATEVYGRFDMSKAMGLVKLDGVIEQFCTLKTKETEIVITDLCLSKDQLIKIFKVFDKIYLYDHHQNSEDFYKKYLTAKTQKFFMSWNKDKCGAKIFYDDHIDTFPSLIKYESLVKYTNIFDLWKKDDSEDWENADGLNTLFWKYHSRDFMKRFSNGFNGFNVDEQDYIIDYSIKVKHCIEKQTEYADVGKTGLISISDNVEIPIMNYVPYYKQGYRYYYFVNRPTGEYYSISIRSRQEKVNLGKRIEYLKATYPDIIQSSGGHSEACGITFINKNVSIDTVLKTIEQVSTQLESEDNA